MIDHVRDLIVDGEIFAVPLHGARKLHRVARCDRLEFTAALLKLDKREATGAVKAVDEEIAVVVVTIEIALAERRAADGFPGPPPPLKITTPETVRTARSPVAGSTAQEPPPDLRVLIGPRPLAVNSSIAL